MTNYIGNACDFLRAKGIRALAGAISTGSGQNLSFEPGNIATQIDYRDIPGMDEPGVSGHLGVLTMVRTQPDELWAVWLGRRHFYQGYNRHEVGYYVDVSSGLGARSLVCVNAAGGLDPGFEVGNLVVIEKFKVFVPVDGVSGTPDGGEWALTSPELASRLESAAQTCGIPLLRGSYAGVPGPVYETAAEVKWLRTLGCNVVGMSTVLELRRGRELGMDSIALSLIANVHGSGVKLTHDEVVRAGNEGSSRVTRLIHAFLGIQLRD